MRTPSLKILLSIPSLCGGKGGAERVAAELANEMTARGHRIFVHSASTPERQPSYPLEPAVHHIQVPMTKPDELRAAIAAAQPDAVFFFYATRQLLKQYAVAAPLNLPLGAQECTNPIRAVDNFAKCRPDHLSDAYLLRNALLAGMHGIRLTMPSYLNYVPTTARPSARAFHNTFRAPTVFADPGKTTGRKRIINVGGLKTANKNGLVLIRAFASIANEFPDWDLHFFGKNELTQARATAPFLRFRGRIVLHGPTEDIYSHYAGSQIHVITSFQEGCPNVVCEAMFHGLPTIGFSDCPGTNELVRDGENGLLIPRSDEVGNLATALRTLMAQPEQRARLGDQARLDAVKSFDRQLIYDNWEDLFQHIASYKSDPARLHREQLAINSAEALELRRLRTYFLTEHRWQQVPAPAPFEARPHQASDLNRPGFSGGSFS